MYVFLEKYSILLENKTRLIAGCNVINWKKWRSQQWKLQANLALHHETFYVSCLFSRHKDSAGFNKCLARDIENNLCHSWCKKGSIDLNPGSCEHIFPIHSAGINRQYLPLPFIHFNMQRTFQVCSIASYCRGFSTHEIFISIQSDYFIITFCMKEPCTRTKNRPLMLRTLVGQS